MAAQQLFYECRRCDPTYYLNTYEDLRAHLRARHSQRELDSNSISLYETYRGAYADERALNRQSSEARRLQRDGEAIANIMSTCQREFAGMTRHLQEEMREEMARAEDQVVERAVIRVNGMLGPAVKAAVKNACPEIVRHLLAEAITSIGSASTDTVTLATAVSTTDLSNIAGPSSINQPTDAAPPEPDVREQNVNVAMSEKSENPSAEAENSVSKNSFMW